MPSLGGLGLSDLALVVREDEVHTSAVDVEVLPEVLTSHGRALGMPAREAFAPRAGPAHDVLGLGLLPQGEVQWIALLVLPVEAAGVGEHILDTSAA